MKEAVLLDLDGTLADPREGITRCIRHALEKQGVASPPLGELERFIGPPLRETFARLLPDASAESVEAAVAGYRERFADVGLFENELYDGIPAALEALVESGARLFVATSKPAVYARRILEHFGIADRFEGVWGPELDGTFDDKTEMVGALLEREGLARAGTVLVGDRLHDIRAARAHGLSSIGATYGYGSADELLRSGADRLAADPAEVLDRARGLLEATAHGGRLRHVVEADVPPIWAMNQQSSPEVGDVPLQAIADFAREAAYFRVAELDGEVVGFLIGLGPDADYASENFRWFRARYESFVYIDRVVIAEHARRRGLGVALYGDIERFAAARAPLVACEVNVRPRNDPSLAFHHGLGYREVGQQDTTGGAKRVSLMTKPVAKD